MLRLRSLWVASVLLALGLPVRADTVFRPAPSVGVQVSPVVAAPQIYAPNGSIIRQPAITNQFGRRWQESESGLLIPANGSLLEKNRLDGLFDGNGAESSATPVVPPAAKSGLGGRELLNQLTEQASKGQRPHDYHDARRAMFGTVDNVLVNGVRGVIDSYSGIFVAGKYDEGGDYKERGDQNGDGVSDRAMNAEHIWPQSFFESRSPMRSDLHHLVPTFTTPNEMRGHLPFGEVKGKPEYQTSGGAKLGGGVFEPPDFMKGRVARALFYFYTRYNNQNVFRGAFGHNFWNGNLEMLMRWHRQFPPTPEEIERNNRIETYQGNRNPFVDDASLVDQIGIQGFQHSGKFRNSSFRPAESRSSDRYKGRNGRHNRRRR